jgi:hypothetical protein
MLSQVQHDNSGFQDVREKYQGTTYKDLRVYDVRLSGEHAGIDQKR